MRELRDDYFGVIRNAARGADDMFELSTSHKRLGVRPPLKLRKTGWIDEGKAGRFLGAFHQKRRHQGR
jgi:hypothetical protein